METTTFHTLDDIKTKARELGYELVRQKRPVFQRSVDVIAEGHQNGILDIDVFHNGSCWLVRLFNTTISGKKSCIMYSETSHANELINFLEQAVKERDELQEGKWS